MYPSHLSILDIDCILKSHYAFMLGGGKTLVISVPPGKLLALDWREREAVKMPNGPFQSSFYFEGREVRE